MIRRFLSNIKKQLALLGVCSKCTKQKAELVIKVQHKSIKCQSHREWCHLFKVLPKILQCRKEAVIKDPNFSWARKYPYVVYHSDTNIILCQSTWRLESTISYEEFWEYILEVNPKISRHSLENLL